MKRTRVWYEIGEGLPLNHAAYIRYENRRIVFCGLYNSKVGEPGFTVNHWKRIINAIAQLEKIDPADFQFYDLQTPVGYPFFRPGEYVFHALQPQWENGEIAAIQSQAEHCPPGILEDFESHIKEGNPEAPIRNRSVSLGVLKAQPKNMGDLTFHDVLDTMMFVEQRCARHKEHSFLELFKRRCAMVNIAVCRENDIDLGECERGLATLPRTTPLGELSRQQYANLLAWLEEQDPGFVEYERPQGFPA